MADFMYDLTIIGGGPAGTSAAITASRAGAAVLLLERGRFPRHKVCGEFVSAESLGLLRTLLESGHAALMNDAIRIARARVFVDSRTIETAIQPAAASLARFDLDAALWRSALQCGVDARHSVTVQRITAGGPFGIGTSVGEFETRAVINASGRWSNLSVAPLANGKPQEKWLGLKAHFEEDSPPASVDLYFFDGGYCGVQPVNLRDASTRQHRINACAMVRAEIASTLADVFNQHPALTDRSRDWQMVSEPVSTSPLIFRDPEPMRDGILLAGDAAGFVDPFVGDGISLALRSGALAASSLAPFFRRQISFEEAAGHYHQAYEQQLAPVFRASSQIRQALRWPRPVRTPILYMLENVPAMTRYLVSKTR
jgi:menaquinone-9 beta-reductase